MKIKCLVSGIIFSISLGVIIPANATELFGVILDFYGETTVINDENTQPADLGVGINFGDKIILKDGAEVVVVSYPDCQEWELRGPDKISIIQEKGFQSKENSFKPSRLLPTCFKPEDLKTPKASSIGGLVLRSGKKRRDPLAGLKKEFEEGRATNSTLMILLQGELKKGNSNSETIQKYIKILKKNKSESDFVKKIDLMIKNRNQN